MKTEKRNEMINLINSSTNSHELDKSLKKVSMFIFDYPSETKLLFGVFKTKLSLIFKKKRNEKQ